MTYCYCYLLRCVTCAVPQKFDGNELSFENGVFLGPLLHLTFKGSYMWNKRQLYFDVATMYLGLGPWRLALPLKTAKPLAEVPAKYGGGGEASVPLQAGGAGRGDVGVGRLWGEGEGQTGGRGGRE